jgi:hypothetical protein
MMGSFVYVCIVMGAFEVSFGHQASLAKGNTLILLFFGFYGIGMP